MTTYPYTSTIAQDAMHEHDEPGFSFTTPEGDSYFVSEDWQLYAANDITDCFRYTRYLIHRDVTCRYMSKTMNDDTLADNGFSVQIIEGLTSHVLNLLARTHANIVEAQSLISNPEEKDGIIAVLLPILMKEPEAGSDTPAPTAQDQATYTQRAIREIIIKHMEVLADDTKQLKEIALSKMPYASEKDINFDKVPLYDIFGDIVTSLITAQDVCMGEGSLFTLPPSATFNDPATEVQDITKAHQALLYNFGIVHNTLFPETETADAATTLEHIFLEQQEHQLQKLMGGIGLAFFPENPEQTLPLYRAGLILSDLSMIETVFKAQTDPHTHNVTLAYESWGRPEAPEALLTSELEVIMQAVHHAVQSGILLPDVMFEVKAAQDEGLTDEQNATLINNGPEALLTPHEKAACDKAHSIICDRLTQACSLLKTNTRLASHYTKLVEDDPQRLPALRSIHRHPAPARLQ